MAAPAVALRIRRRGFPVTASPSISPSGGWLAHGSLPVMIECMSEEKSCVCIPGTIFAWSRTDREDLLLCLDNTRLSVYRSSNCFAAPEPVGNTDLTADGGSSALLACSGRDIAISVNGDLQVGRVDDEGRIRLILVSPRPQKLVSMTLTRGWLWAATSSSLLLWHLKEIVAPSPSPLPSPTSSSSALNVVPSSSPAPQRSFSLTAILPNDFQGRDSATITSIGITPDLRHMLLAVNSSRLALLDLDQFLHQRPVLKETAVQPQVSRRPSSSALTTSSSFSNSGRAVSSAPTSAPASRWYERTVSVALEESKRAASLAVNGFNKKILSYGVEDTPTLQNVSTYAIVSPVLEHPISSILTADSCIAALASPPTSASSFQSTATRWSAFTRPSLTPVDVPLTMRSLAMVNGSAADERWLQLIGPSGSYILLAGFGQQALLHNLVLFESQPLAVEVCAMNDWQEKELRLAAVSLGLEYRQASVLQPALDSLSPDQHLPAARRLLESLITAAASALDRGLLQRLFLIATRFLGRVLAERSAQLYASHAGTLRPQPHLLLPVGALSPAQAEARSDVEFLSQALEQLRSEWRRISAPDVRPTRDTLVVSRVRPTTAAMPLSFVTFPASPSAVDASVPSTPESERPLKERKRNALRPRILFASPPATPSSGHHNASSDNLVLTADAEAASGATLAPTLAQLLPRGALERWERLTDGEIVKDGLLRGRLSLALAFLRTRGGSLASACEATARLVQQALSHLQVEQAAEMLQQLGRPVTLHLLALALHAYRPLLRQQLLSLLKFRNVLPVSLSPLLQAASELEKAYPSASYSLESSHRVSASPRPLLPATGRPSEWLTGDVTEPVAEGETTVTVLSRRHGWTAGEGGERGAYAQFSLLLLAHTLPHERLRLLIDANPSLAVKNQPSAPAALHYLVSHSLLATLQTWLVSLSDSDAAAAAASLHSLLDSGTRLPPAARDLAQDALAIRGYFLPSELASPPLLLARAARTWQAFSLLQRHKLPGTAAADFEEHFLRLCLSADLPHALEAYAELNPSVSLAASPEAPSWLPLWSALRGSPSVWTAALASAAYLSARSNSAYAALTTVASSAEGIIAAAKTSGLLDKPAVALASFVHSSCIDLAPLVAALRAHNPALLTSWLTDYPLLAELLAAPVLSPQPTAPLPLRSSRGDVSLLPLVESALGVRLSRAEPVFDDTLPPSAAVQQASALDLSFFLETAQPLHAFAQATTDEQAEELARNTSLSRPKDDATTAACIAFLELRGQFNAAQLLRVDTEATRRVLEWSGSPPASDLLALLHSSSPESLLRFLSLLEEATRASVRQDWPLVSRFCRAHALPPSARRFEELAASSDWVLFLQEAETHAFAPSALLPLVSRFASPSLREHLLVFLGAWKGLSPEKLILASVALPLGSNSSSSSSLSLASTSVSLLSLLLSAPSTDQALAALLRNRSSAASVLPLSSDLTALLLAALCSGNANEIGTAKEAAELAEGQQSSLMSLCDMLLYIALPSRRDFNRAAAAVTRYLSALSMFAPSSASANAPMNKLFDNKRIAEAVSLLLLRLPLAPAEKKSLHDVLAPHLDALIPLDSAQHVAARELLAALQTDDNTDVPPTSSSSWTSTSSSTSRAEATLRVANRMGLSTDQPLLTLASRLVSSAVPLKPPLRAPLWRAVSALLGGNSSVLSLVLPSNAASAPLPATVKPCSPAAASSFLRDAAGAILSSSDTHVPLDSAQEACLLLELAQTHASNSETAAQLLLLPLAFKFLFWPALTSDLVSSGALLVRLRAVLLTQKEQRATEQLEEQLALCVNGDRLAVAEQVLALLQTECTAVRISSIALQLAYSSSSSAAQEPLYRSLSALLPPQVLPPANNDTSAALAALRRQSLSTRPFLRRLAFLFDASRALELPFAAVHQRPPLELLSDLLQAPAAWSGESSEVHRILTLAKALADATNVPNSALPPLVARVVFSRLERDEGLVASTMHLQPFMLFSRNARAVADRLLDLIQSAGRGLTPSQTADGLIAAYGCYSAASHASGQDKVVSALRERSFAWLQAGEVKLLVRLLVSVPADLQSIFDALLEHDQFERILSRAAGVKKDTEMAETRALLLRYLLRSPHCDEEKLSLFRLAFQLWTDSARAAKSAADRLIGSPKPSPDDLLRAVQLYLDASNGFSKDRAVRSSLRCLALGKLVALQLRQPSIKLLGLGLDEAKAAMASRPMLDDAQTLADAYECSAPADWAVAVYVQTIKGGNFAFLSEFLHAAPIPTSFIFSELVRRFRADPQKAVFAANMRAVLGSMESQYLAWELARELGPAFEDSLKTTLPAALLAFFRTTR